MKSVTSLLLAASLLVACGPSAPATDANSATPTTPPAAAPPPAEVPDIMLAGIDTPEGELPPGWAHAVTTGARFYAKGGDIYFEYMGGENTLTYDAAPDIAGGVILTFDWEVDGNAPACEAGFSQGAQGDTKKLTEKAPYTFTIVKEANAPARVVFTCTSAGKVWGWIRKPKIEVAKG